MKPLTLLPLIALLPLSLSAAQDAPTPAPAAEQPAADLTPAERALFTRWNNGHRHTRTPQWWNEEPRSLFSSRLIVEDGRPQAYEQRIATLSEDGMTLTLLTRRAAFGKAGFTYTKEVRHAMALKGLQNDVSAPYTFVRELSTPGEVEVEHWQLDPATHDLLRVARTRFNMHDFNSMEQAKAQVAWAKPTAYADAYAPLVRIEQRNDPKDVDHWPDPTRDPKYDLSPDGKHMVYAFENATGAIQYHFTIFTREGDAWVQEPQEGSICTRWCGLDYELTDEGIIGIIVDDELELALASFIPYTTGGSMSFRTTHEEQRTPLVEAAASGDADTVRALLTCPAIDPGAVDTAGNDATMVTDNPEIIAPVRAAQGPHYDRLAALNAAIGYWKAVTAGEVELATNGFPQNYVRDLLIAKLQHLATRYAKGLTSPAEIRAAKAELADWEQQHGLTDTLRDMYEELFEGWGGNELFRHGEVPEWDAKRRALYSTQLTADAEGNPVYIETVRRLSPDGMKLETITRSALCGVAGFFYDKEVDLATAPGEFHSEFRADDEQVEEEMVEIWNVDPATGELLQISHEHRFPAAPEENHSHLYWQKPAPYHAEDAPLVIFNSLVGDKLMASAEPDPTGDPRYSTSPDGKRLVLALQDCTGAWSYHFTTYTREGNAWVQEPGQNFFGSRACPLDYALTDEGIRCMLVDNELELCIPLFFPYTGSGNGLWYRGVRREYAAPLHDAARAGQVEIVRALLTCPAIDPDAVNDQGQDASMVTDNAEIISLIRAAQGAK